MAIVWKSLMQIERLILIITSNKFQMSCPTIYICEPLCNLALSTATREHRDSRAPRLESIILLMGERGARITTPPWKEWPPTAIAKLPPAALGCAVLQCLILPCILQNERTIDPAGSGPGRRRACAELCCLRVGDAL